MPALRQSAPGVAPKIIVNEIWLRLLLVVLIYSLGTMLLLRRPRNGPVSPQRRRFQIILAIAGGCILAAVMAVRIISG